DQDIQVACSLTTKTRKKQEEQKKQEQKKKKRMSTMMRINIMMNRGTKRMMLMGHPVEASTPKSLLVMRRIIIGDVITIQNRGMKRMRLISHPIKALQGQPLVTRMMDLCTIDKEKSDMENGIWMMMLMGITFAFRVSTHQEMSHWGSSFKNVVNYGWIRMFQQGASHVVENLGMLIEFATTYQPMMSMQGGINIQAPFKIVNPQNGEHEGTPSVSIQEYAVLYEIFIQSAAGSGQSHQMRKLTELIPSEYVERLLGDFSERLECHSDGWGIGHCFLLQCTPGDDVFVDVALELSVKEGAVMWCSDGHAVVLQRLLQMHQTEADKWMCFGCHITTHTTPLRQFNATFVQMYTTDKCLTYDMQASNNAKFVTAVNLMKKSKYTYNEFLGKLYGVFADAAWHNNVHARIEVRVPLANAEDVFADVPVWQNEEHNTDMRHHYYPVILTCLVAFMEDHHMILPCTRKRDGTDEPGPYAEGGLWWIPSSVIAWPTWNGGGCTRKAKGRPEGPMLKTERLARQIEMPEKSYDYGPDLPPQDQIYDEQYLEHAGTFLNQVLQQYVSDMLQKVGQAKCGWEHSPLTQNEWRMVDIRIMKENDLRGVLTHARMHEGTESQWNSLFDNIFWTLNELNARKQRSARSNWGKMKSIKMWEGFVHDMSSSRQVEDMRRALKRAFDEFLCGHMPALRNVEEWGDREDEEEIMSIIEREEREKQKEMDTQEREDRILREHREEEESLEDEVEPDIRRQITDEREPITMEGNRGMLLGEPIVSPSQH
ncbi:uncharacterized protein BT62DRAFT_924773, partial [Guyanagaster necrorhizus]